MVGRLLAVLVAMASVASADSSVRAPERAGDREAEAREHYRRGTAFYDQERWQDAVIEYDIAFRLSDRPELLFNIAQAYRMDGQYAAALTAYRDFLRRKPDSPNRADVERHIHGLENLIATARPPAPPPPVAPPPPPMPAPMRMAADERTTYIRIAGEEATEDKQRRCDEVLMQRGWRLQRDARVQVVMTLTPEANDLSVVVDGRAVARRPLGREGMRQLCAIALDELTRVPLEARPRFEPGPSAVPRLARPPTEKDLGAALRRQSWALSACRTEFAKQVAKIEVAVLVGPNGDIGSVEVAGVDPASRFGGCVQRILRQIRFATFGGEAHPILKTTFSFPPVVIDG